MVPSQKSHSCAIGGADVMSRQPSDKRLGLLAVLGPGLAMAAFGVGAGDVTTTALGGARFGLALLWVPIVASVMKYALNEGLARWQLATGETLLEGWASRMGPIVTYGFLVYLIGWSVPVFGTLIATTGLTVNLLLPLDSVLPVLHGPVFTGGPDRSPVTWSFLLVVVVFLLVWLGHYELFEKIMSFFVLTMALVILLSGLLLLPSVRQLSDALGNPWPKGSLASTLAIMGGTGSTVGVMAYSYWMRERQRRGPGWLRITWIDLTACYVVSAVFGVCMIVLAGGMQAEAVREALGLAADAPVTRMSLEQIFRLVRYRLVHETSFGPAVGEGLGMLFGISLAATVASSLLGLMQSVPYLYADFWGLIRGAPAPEREAMTQQRSRCYRLFLTLLAVSPLPLVVWKRPTMIVMIYAVWGSFFMPFLAATLLYMNNRSDWVGSLRNRWRSNLVLGLCLLIFGVALLYTGYAQCRRGLG